MEAKAQRVLVTNVGSLDDGDKEPLMRLGENNSRILQHATCETSDVLMTPKLLENNHGDVKSAVQSVQNGSIVALPLHAIQQAVILAKCLLIERSSRQDELQSNVLTMFSLFYLWVANVLLLFGRDVEN